MWKYLAVFGLVLGVFVYAFFQDEAERTNALTPGQARYRAIVEHVNMLERRRMELFRPSAGLSGPPSGAGAVFSGPAGRALTTPGRAGAYGRGYALGFSQGYRIGEFLSSSRKPSPLFFPVPSPY